jgi:tetratricopeptide (TPR) repeat protein
MDEGLDANGFDKCLKRFEQMLTLDTEYYFDVDDLENLVEHFMIMAEFDKADRAIELARHQHPGCAEFDKKQAELLTLSGQFDRAIKLLSRLENLEPENPEIQVSMGTAFSRKGDHTKALEYFLSALKKTSDPTEVRMMIAFEYLSLSQADEGLNHLKIALECKPMRSALINETAFFFDRMDDPDGAITFFTEHSDSHPYCVSAWFNLGMFQMRIGQYDEAIIALGFCNAIDPSDHLTAEHLANCYLQMDNIAKAKEYFTDAIELEPEYEDSLLGLSECYELEEDFKNCEKTCRKVLELDPENSDAWFRLGSVKFREEKFVESLDLIKRSIESDPQMPSAWALLGENLIIMEKVDEALAAYDKAIELDSQDFQVWLTKAISTFHRLEEEEGIVVMMEGIKHIPDSAELNFGMAALMLISGREQEGLTYLQRGLDLNREKHVLLFQVHPEAAYNPHVVDLIDS